MIKNYVNGKVMSHGTHGFFQKINPSDEMVITTINNTVIDGVELAVNAAKNAFVNWKKVSRFKRGEYFDKLAQLVKRDADLLARKITLETGKNLNESMAEVNETLHSFQYWAGLSKMPYGHIIASEIDSKTTYVERFPKGVVAVLSPFNFPAAILSAWSSAPAILEGNTVVIKPSEFAPITANAIIELYHEAGFPDGVINVIYGDAKTGELLVRHRDVNCILFTGSYNVSKSIRAACVNDWNKTVYSECGSKTAIIIDKGFNIDLAVDICIPSAFKLSSQRCVSASRLIINRDIMDKFVDLFVAKVDKLKIGDPLNEENIYFGPLINKSAVEKALHYNNLSIANKARILMNGIRIDRKGYFVSPHIYISEWNSGHNNLTEECFAPHLAIIPFDSIEDAVNINNDVDYGLALSCLTNDYRVAKYIKDNSNYGIGYHNCGCIGSESHVPFTATRKSGDSSSAAGTIKSVTYEKTWTVNYEEGFQFSQGLV